MIGEEKFLPRNESNQFGLFTTSSTARRHTSILKDYAPLAGRDFRATLRVEI